MTKKQGYWAKNRQLTLDPCRGVPELSTLGMWLYFCKLPRALVFNLPARENQLHSALRFLRVLYFSLVALPTAWHSHRGSIHSIFFWGRVGMKEWIDKEWSHLLFTVLHACVSERASFSPITTIFWITTLCILEPETGFPLQWREASLPWLTVKPRTDISLCFLFPLNSGRGWYCSFPTWISEMK